jgi:CysZ protein
MLRALLLAIRQIGDAAFLRPLLFAAALTLLGMIGLAWGVSAGVGWLAGGEGWIATVASGAGALLVVLGVIWLFVPLVIAVAGLFLDGVATAVERRHYPTLPPPDGASVAAQAWSGLKIAAGFGLLTLVLLPVSLLLPVIGPLLLWAVAAVALGEGFFIGVAQRRMGVAASDALRRQRRASIWGVGAALALLAAVPPLGLLVPVLGTAAMVHLLEFRRHD